MRHHFHRCTHLRVVSAQADDLHGAHHGGGIILEELCDARHWTPCVGLAECDILAAGQKQDLLVARATQMRQEEGGSDALSGLPHELGEQIRVLRQQLHAERERITADNEEIQAELAEAWDVHGPAAATDEYELAREGISIRLDEAQEKLRVERLDALDRALDAMASPSYGICALCKRPVGIERLRASPETRVCLGCARGGSGPGDAGDGDG